MDSVETDLGIKKPEDWYRVRLDQVLDRGGAGLLVHFGHSMRRLLAETRTPPAEGWGFEVSGLEERSSLQTTSWTSATRKEYVRALGNKLGYSRPEDWYQIRASHFKEHGGYTLLSYYGSSPSRIVKDLVDPPEGGWRDWLFLTIPKRYWESAENRKAFVEWLAQKKGWSKPEDWYQISRADLVSHGGNGLLKLSTGASGFVMENVSPAPEGGWKSENFSKSARQRPSRAPS